MISDGNSNKIYAHMDRYLESKPLTPKIKALLMECHERELLNLEPYEAALCPGISGLFLRQMIITEQYILKSRKKIIAVFLTPNAKAYLSTL